MANFLSRIALRGAGTRPLAHPSTIAPPILPGRTPLAEPEVQSDEPISPAIAQPGPQLPQPARPASSPAREETGPDNRRASAEPPAERRAEAAPPMRAAELPTPPPKPLDRESTPSPQPRPERNPDVVRVPRRIEASQAGDAGQLLQIASTPEPDAVIRAPKSSLRPASVEGFSTAFPRLEHSGALQKDHRTSEPPEIRPPSPSPAPEQPLPAIARASIPSMNQFRITHEEARPSVPLSPPQMPVGGNQSRREPRVSIGQVDVQVINQPPSIPSAPRVAVAPAESISFFNGEIERFRCRLL
jgi:hypothetical protein